MESRKKDIESVNVSQYAIETNPPQYSVTIQYKDQTKKNKTYVENDIVEKYGVYLNEHDRKRFNFHHNSPTFFGKELSSKDEFFADVEHESGYKK